jgi:curved DNA-binding protein
LLGGGFSDFFNSIFGMAGGRARRGRDLEQPISISLAEAYQGTTRAYQRNGRRLEVEIPPGARSGTRIRLAGAGQGEPGRSGDLYLKVEVMDQPGVKRRGDNLHQDLTVDLYTAVLGGEVQLQTFQGPVLLRIPPGSQPGQTFRLRGRGMPKLRDPKEHGDLFARLQVTLPANLTDQERALFEQLAGLRGPGT